MPTTQEPETCSGTRDARLWGWHALTGFWRKSQVDDDGNLKVYVSGQAGGGSSVSIADGANVVEGAVADVAVTGDNAGTLSAKLRGLSKMVSDVWDSVNHRFNVTVGNATLAVTQSGSWVLSAGAAVIGSFTINRTTPGTTNTVAPIAGQDGVAGGAGAVSALVQRVVLATDTTVPNVTGNVAHDGVDSGNPVKIGSRAVAYGTNPTGTAAADRADQIANVAGIPFVLLGHPNIITRRDNYTTAQTDTALIAVSGGSKIVVTECSIVTDAACTVKPLARAGFGAANTPTGAGVYVSHPGIPAGGGMVARGPVAGADGEDFRFTCAVPTGGSIEVVTKYFTIEV